MPQPRHILFALALGSAILGGAALAQDNSTIGPPDLRDFTISGERTTPPAPAEPPAVINPPPVAVPEPEPTTAEAQPEAPPPAAESTTSSPAGDQREQVQSVSEGETAPVASVNGPVTETRSAPLADPTEIEQPEPASPSAAGGLPWLYILLGGVGAGLATLLLLRLRKNRGAEDEESIAEEPMLAAEPVPAQIPQPRPWIELEFKPGKAAATDAQASVEYELKIANVGDAEARKVRIEARLFNAQQDSEIGEFFSAPGLTQAMLAPRAIQPRGGALFKSVVALPKDQVQEVIVQGRRLFIPMIAFNVLYEWGNGETGQTSMSYIVGRETEPPAEKMAPFRLDLGPRIYRSVGFRPSKLALTV